MHTHAVKEALFEKKNAVKEALNMFCRAPSQKRGADASTQASHMGKPPRSDGLGGAF